MKDIYTTENSDYKKNNPTWHVEDSPWKAQQILKMVTNNRLNVKSIVEIGCGVGEILNQLHIQLPNSFTFFGYDISKDAYEESKSRMNERLIFHNQDLLEQDIKFDLLLMIDVFEHVDDYLGFIRKTKSKADYFIFHIPLDLSISALFRNKLIDARKSVGHLHYYSKETALATLDYCNLEILDYFYTNGAISLGGKFRTKLLNLIRRISFFINQDMTVRIFGGYSLLVLAKNK